jgi:hypothetical protein
MKILRSCVVLVVSLLPIAAHAASLQVHNDAGDSANVVATCQAGSYPYGDPRGCSDAPPAVTLPGPVTVVNSAAHAVYPTGFDSQAESSASLGTLRAFAQSSIPVSDGIGHNLQSHAYADMQDTLVASSSFGTLYNNYNYTVNITGAATASSPIYAVPSFTANAYVQLNIRMASSGDVLVQKYWETSATELGGGVISGTLLGVPMDAVLSLELFMQTDTQLGTNDFGQSTFAQADYSNTVHFYLDALTPGANTVSTGGHDYAMTAVPEPATVWSSAVGLSVLCLKQGRRRRRNAPRAPSALRIASGAAGSGTSSIR